MVQLGFATLAFALLPLPLLSTGLAEPICWTVSSVLFALFGVYVPMLGRRAFREDRAAGRPTNLAVFTLLVGGSFLTAPLLAYNAVSLHAFWPYLAALVWFEVATALAFLRVVLSLARS
jgi:hypothetical protein